MFKKFFTYPVFLVLFLAFIGAMGFGSIVKYKYEGGKKYQFLQKTVMFISEIPLNVKKIIENNSLDLNRQPNLPKHKDKKKFKQYIENKRNALLVLPRHDHSLSRSVVDIVDLNNFEVIHTYKHDITEMESQSSIEENIIPVRFNYQHPLIFDDGSLISIDSIMYKLDFCSNLQWVKQKGLHHSQMIDHEGNIWSGSQMDPESEYIKKYSVVSYKDDSIIKLNSEGKILFHKSITELLIENNILSKNFVLNFVLNSPYTKDFDPIHLNDVEPAFFDTEYWKQGDVFISIRHQSAIIHYRPSINKVINYITGPFAEQHDVDIISDKEISIFNNNNFLINNDHSEVLIYNFETKTFKKLFNDQLQKENFQTKSQGLSHILKDRSIMVEEQNHGRIILFNNKGEKEWEFVNKDKNGDIGYINWTRIIEDEMFIEKFKSVIKNKKC